MIMVVKVLSKLNKKYDNLFGFVAEFRLGGQDVDVGRCSFIRRVRNRTTPCYEG